MFVVIKKEEKHSIKKEKHNEKHKFPSLWLTSFRKRLIEVFQTKAVFVYNLQSILFWGDHISQCLYATKHTLESCYK